MIASEIGAATLHARVESWECDHNKHWNARYYARSFQMAAETVAALSGRENRGLSLIGARHIRYHRELLVGAAVEVRSARVAEGDHAGALVHLLFGEGRLAATALDLPGTGAEILRAVAPDELVLALPRGLAGTTPDEWNAASLTDFVAETGPVRPADVDHTGSMLFEDIIRRVTFSSHAQLTGLGLDVEYVNENGIGRMAVETRVTLSCPCQLGAHLRVRSRIVTVAARSFTTNHRLETYAGELVARIELHLVMVDLKRRRVVEIPGFLRRLLS